MSKTENNEIKVLPQSEEAEKALLGCMIVGAEREQEIGMAWIRDNEAFYFPDNKSIWISLKDLYKNNIEIDFVTLSDKVKEISGDSMAY